MHAPCPPTHTFAVILGRRCSTHRLILCTDTYSFNDGFGGGSEVTENLGYNTCRESSDHGEQQNANNCSARRCFDLCIFRCMATC